MSYSITIAKSAARELGKLPRDVIQRVSKKIDSLRSDPRPAGVLKLAGSDNLYRVRVGDYRVIYSIDDVKRAVDIVHVRHRREAYE